MRKDGRETRREIIEKSLQIFSVKGYYNTSVSDIMAATGLTKGGLYAHFDSKEDLWNAAYERAVEIWRGIVFKDVRNVSDPLDRIGKTIENDLRDYCCGEVFEGGCFFFNSLVELSGQSAAMSGRVMEGFTHFSDLLASWLEEAKSEGKLRPGVRIREVADFIVTSINGAAALYAATRNSRFPQAIEHQINTYLRMLRA
ncbi:MAG TPA: TetR/AcrR family transcriptional regulator [Candidatus Deferrimicrobium sp.]|nr:TetR/AcrR family transcriptional regulator [Candidatus Deferrimicrobium sp.]